MSESSPPVEIGSRLEPFVDRFLVDELDGAYHRLAPVYPAEKAIAFDRPWEGRYSGYTTAMPMDGGGVRLYYRGDPAAGKDTPAVTCVAESDDGVHFERPELDLYEIEGYKTNNVICAGDWSLTHNFAPWIDDKPGVPDSERFKALAGTVESGLIAFASPDGLHWSKMRQEPVMTKAMFPPEVYTVFDSQNVAFWSEAEGCYCAYVRWFGKPWRSIARLTSGDFLNWSPPVEMDYGDTPREQLYINQTIPYFRAPHIYISLAARFMSGRRVLDAEEFAAIGGEGHYGQDCSDAVLMSTRGGARYDRTFMEAFLRPGPDRHAWTSRTNYPARGIVPVSETEMAFYVNRDYGQPTAHLQRVRMRTDGFASVGAGYEGGEMRTRPIVFDGGSLTLNYATSAAGSARVEIQDAAGQPIEGFALRDADELVGDEISRTASWGGKSDVSPLAGNPVRLRFALKDADVYALRFTAE